MFIDKRCDQYWVWSSKKASLDCMPQFKSESLLLVKQWIWKKKNRLIGKVLTYTQVRLMRNFTNGFYYGK